MLSCAPAGWGPRRGDQATSCAESPKLAWVAHWTVPRRGLAEAGTGAHPGCAVLSSMRIRRATPDPAGAGVTVLAPPPPKAQHLLPGCSSGRAWAQAAQGIQAFQGSCCWTIVGTQLTALPSHLGGWYAIHAVNTTAERGSSGPGLTLQGHSDSGGFSLVCAHESPMNSLTSTDVKVS